MFSLMLIACGGSSDKPAPDKAALSLLAGQLGGQGNTDGPQGRFMGPNAIVADHGGNLYVNDGGVIRKVTPDGSITTLAGVTAGSLSTLALDGANNLYAADPVDKVIYKITPAGAKTPLAWTGRVDGLKDIVADDAGNLYVTDILNDVVLKLTANGVVITLAGTFGVAGSADGIGAAATFWSPSAIAIDGAGNVYVANSASERYGNGVVRKITPDGVVSTLAGNPSNHGSVDGIGTAAGFSHILDLTADREGNLYVVEDGSRTVRKITPAGVVTTLAGANLAEGSTDGVGAEARFMGRASITVDGAGNIYVADQGSTEIRKITPDGKASTLAGKAGGMKSIDGTGAAASFSSIGGLALEGAGNAYVADGTMIRKVAPTGTVTTLAGDQKRFGSVDGIGNAASFTFINGVAVDGAGNVYVAESRTIRKINPAGEVTTLAGRSIFEYTAPVDGTGDKAGFSFIHDIAADRLGNIYAADSTAIRKITPAGVVTTLAGQVEARGASDGVGTAARFTNLSGIAVDRNGNVYVSDAVLQVACIANSTGCGGNIVSNTIRKITPEGVVTTLAGATGVTGSADGKGTAASFNDPTGIAVDEMGNVFVADRNNHTIRKVTPDGIVTTVAGKPGSIGVLLGALPGSLSYPERLAISSDGVLYITSERVVLKLIPK